MSKDTPSNGHSYHKSGSPACAPEAHLLRYFYGVMSRSSFVGPSGSQERDLRTEEQVVPIAPLFCVTFVELSNERLFANGELFGVSASEVLWPEVEVESRGPQGVVYITSIMSSLVIRRARCRCLGLTIDSGRLANRWTGPKRKTSRTIISTTC